MENPQNQPMQQTQIPPVLHPEPPKNPYRKAMVVALAVFLLVLVAIPFPYYQREELTCKSGQRCPGIGWHLGLPFYRSIVNFFLDSRPKATVQLRAPTSTPAPTASPTANWNAYTVEKLSLQFSVPSFLSVTVDPEPNPNASTIYIQSYPYNAPLPKGYYQLYLIAQSNPTPGIGTLDSLKKDLALTTETTVDGLKAITGYPTNDRNRYIVYFVRGKTLYSLFVSETTPENIDLTTSILSTFKFIDKTGTSLKQPDSQTPAAGVCAEQTSSTLAIVNINADTPSPRCLKVRADQQLKIVNNTDQSVRVTLGRLQSTISPGGNYVDGEKFGSYLAPGVHSVQVIPSFSFELWLF